MPHGTGRIPALLMAPISVLAVRACISPGICFPCIGIGEGVLPLRGVFPPYILCALF